MDFGKPAKTFEEQLDLLIERGMIVEDRTRAIHYLSHLNYYRLAAYWLPYEADRAPHKFVAGTTFEQVLTHYLFDREFRLHLLDAIERIEISFRTQWAYHISHQYGPHGYLVNNKSLRKNERRLLGDIEELRTQIVRSDETYIAHFRKKYDEDFPPAWVSCEIMSLGLISRFYSNLRAYGVRRKIAATYNFDEEFLEGFLEHLTYVRNACAHHSRLWNRHLSKKMPLPKGKPAGLRDNIYIDDANKTEHKIYNTLVLIQHLMTVTCPESHWAIKLAELIDQHGINAQRMGFPPNWKDLPIWSAALAKP
ncbi:MAG: Abi family protein [Gammaproteobacteria bacterium]|nr:MAG: Abi family protein [Gammaproteobacteria bacterium]